MRERRVYRSSATFSVPSPRLEEAPVRGLERAFPYAIEPLCAKLRWMLLTLIAAADEGNVIGRDNALPWKLPADFARMRQLTDGKPLIMGRKTHESIGRVLPGRLNIVVTHDPAKVFNGCTMAGSLEEAIAAAEASGADEAFIFGGEQLYRESLAHADRIQLTRVHAHVDGGDAFFPQIPLNEWRLTFSESHAADDEHAFPFTFETYERA